jgi:hypothetical protein
MISQFRLLSFSSTERLETISFSAGQRAIKLPSVKVRDGNDTILQRE